jgi:hypothetical protein
MVLDSTRTITERVSCEKGIHRSLRNRQGKNPVSQFFQGIKTISIKKEKLKHNIFLMGFSILSGCGKQFPKKTGPARFNNAFPE